VSFAGLERDGVAGIRLALKFLDIVLAAGSMPQNPPYTAENTLDVPPPIQLEPLNVPPLSFLPPHLSEPCLAQPYSASSSNPLGKIPTEGDVVEELEGKARMANKVREAGMKKAFKARNRGGEKGQWWPSKLDRF
jgi:hypothetical protein